MKKILLVLFCSLVTLNADVVLTKKLQDGDIGQDQYQLFVTNTKKVSLKELTPKVVHQGNLYRRLAQNRKVSEYPKDVKVAITKIKDLDEFEDWFDEVNLYNELQNLTLRLTLKYSFRQYFNFEEILKITEYRDDKNKLKTVVYKLLQAQDTIALFKSYDLEDDYDEIFNSSNDTSYQYNGGDISILFSSKQQYDTAMKKRLKTNKDFKNEIY